MSFAILPPPFSQDDKKWLKWEGFCKFSSSFRALAFQGPKPQQKCLHRPMGIPSKSPEHFVEAQVMEVWKPWVSGKLMQSGCIFCSGEPKTWAICLKMWGEKVLTNKNLPKKTVILKNYLKQNIPQRKHSPQTFKKVFPKNIPQRKIWFHWLGFSNSICCLSPASDSNFLTTSSGFSAISKRRWLSTTCKTRCFFKTGAVFVCLCFFRYGVFFCLLFEAEIYGNFRVQVIFRQTISPLRIFGKKHHPWGLISSPSFPWSLVRLPWSPIPPPTLAAKGRSGACSWRQAKTWQAVRNRNGKQRQAGPTLRTKLDDPRESNQPASPHTGWRILIGPLQGTI